MQYSILVKESVKRDTVIVAGVQFSKTLPVVLDEPEMKPAIRRSPLLDVKPALQHIMREPTDA